MPLHALHMNKHTINVQGLLPRTASQLNVRGSGGGAAAAARRRRLAQALALCALLALAAAVVGLAPPPLPSSPAGAINSSSSSSPSTASPFLARLLPWPFRAAAAAAAPDPALVAAAAARRAAAYSFQRPRDRRVALLHKAAEPVTLRGVRAAVEAKRQVEAAGGWYQLVYSVYPDTLPPAAAAGGPPGAAAAAGAANGSTAAAAAAAAGGGFSSAQPASERQRVTLAALRAALGDASVAVVGRGDVERELGRGTLDAYRELLTGKMRQKDWAWSTNDVVDVTWFLLQQRQQRQQQQPGGQQQQGQSAGVARLPDWATHVWSVELDVAWTGDLVDALLLASNGSSADWVGYDTRARVSSRDWFWHGCHNWLPRGAPVVSSMRHAGRYSARLLAAIAASMRARRVQCDEITAPAVCRAHADWCSIDMSWRPGHPASGTDPRTGEDLYRWDSRIEAGQWDAVLAADAAAAAEAARARGDGGGGGGGGGGVGGGILYHKIKW